MTDQTTNFMSNAARMIGFAQGYESVYLRELRAIVDAMPKRTAGRGELDMIVRNFERKHSMLEVWWAKRHEEGVTSETLLAELAQK